MKYFYSKEYASLYFMEDGTLCGMPMWKDGTFDKDETFVPDLDHEEVPRAYYDNVIKLLTQYN